MAGSLPAVALTLYLLAALAIFAVRTRRRGLPVDAEVASRPASPLLGRWIRHYLMWVLSPFERALVRLRVPPTAITLASLAAAAGAGVAMARGCFALGGWLYLATGILDIFDGRVARATGRVSRSGAFIDSVIDRYAELLVFGGLAFYYRGTAWALALVLAAQAGSLMVSYARARGEALGVDVKIGTMQRPERLFYLGVVIAHSQLAERLVLGAERPLHPTAVAALALLALSANVTALRRIRHTVRALDGKTAPATSALVSRARRRLLNLLRTAG